VNATFNDGTSQDVTTLSEWTPSNPAITTVAASGLGTERVTGDAAGSTTISATYTYNNKTVSVQAPATVTVRSRTLQNLTISGSSTVTAGNQVQYTAKAIHSDGSNTFETDVTTDATWSIDNPNVAILADSVNQPGLIVGVDSGSATITASFSDKTKTVSKTATITVTGP